MPRQPPDASEVPPRASGVARPPPGLSVHGGEGIESRRGLPQAARSTDPRGVEPAMDQEPPQSAMGVGVRSRKDIAKPCREDTTKAYLLGLVGVNTGRRS